MTHTFRTLARITVATPVLVAALALGGTVLPDTATGWHGAAFADEDGGSGGPGTGQGNQGGQGQGSQGAQAGQDNQGGQGAGQGGPDPDSDSKGPHAGGPSGTGSGGGKPVWAQEGIPEVELGRLSVARSPDQVLARALAEAIATWDDDMAAFYSLPLTSSDPNATTILTELSLNWDNLSIYDSPLQNLALLEDMLEDGQTQLDVQNDDGTLMAVFLGVASDKNVAISTDTVIAVTTILGYPVEGQAAADLAEDAEAVRIAVLAGHG